MSTPYYADELVTLYHGDCREVREWLDADVLVTDPPYGVRHASGVKRDGHGGYQLMTKATGRFDKVANDRTTQARDDALSLWGTERPGLVFGRWDAPRPAGTRKRLIWDKGDSPGPGNLRLPWGSSDEEVYVLGRWPQRPAGPKRTGSVIRMAGYHSQARDRPDHPTPKPVELYTYLAERCPPGVLADPFAGSGPLALAAHRLGRRVVLVELEERYCHLIASRVTAMLETLVVDQCGDGPQVGGRHVAVGPDTAPRTEITDVAV